MLTCRHQLRVYFESWPTLAPNSSCRSQIASPIVKTNNFSVPLNGFVVLVVLVVLLVVLVVVVVVVGSISTSNWLCASLVGDLLIYFGVRD